MAAPTRSRSACVPVPEELRGSGARRRGRKASGRRLVLALAQVEVRLGSSASSPSRRRVEDAACPAYCRGRQRRCRRTGTPVARIGGVRRVAFARGLLEQSRHTAGRRPSAKWARASCRPPAHEVLRPIVGLREVAAFGLEIEEVLRGLGEVGIERQRAFDARRATARRPCRLPSSALRSSSDCRARPRRERSRGRAPRSARASRCPACSAPDRS